MAPFWKNQELEDAKAQSHVLLDTTQIHDKIPEIFPSACHIVPAFINTPVHVTECLWTDSGLKDWSTKQTILQGSGHYLWNFLRQPIYDKDTLMRRQQCINNISNHQAILEKLKDSEKDILWILNLPKFSETWPLNLAFPTIPILKYINYFPLPLTLFHFYKIIVAPGMTLITPMSTIIGPWLYLRKNLKMDITFKAYTSTLLMVIKQGLSPSKNLKQDGMKYISLFLYIFFYIYSIIQCFEQAHILYKILKNLQEKIDSIRLFITTVNGLMKEYPDLLRDFLPKDFQDIGEPLNIPSQMSGMYVLLTNDKVKATLKKLLQWIYTLDVVLVGKRYITSKTCCLVNYDTSATEFLNMGHILLGTNQVKNPLSLKKNLIITGPNAAGKTTYVRAVCTNTIFAQTFGIACALSAEVSIVHAIGSFMRIEDSLGQLSLFEAEAKRCAELLEQAHKILNNGMSALYFLDEPMHSTPPIEGSATSMAVSEYMGKLPGIRLMVTTHYHECIGLESMYPDYFQNISMDAFTDPITGRYIFPYKIQKGASTKCIALELLNEKNLPNEIIQRAIILKNKICDKQVKKSP